MRFSDVRIGEALTLKSETPAPWRVILRKVSDERTVGSVVPVFVAEIGAIKVRFGDPDVKEWLKFEARYTRYVSDKPPVAQERMI